MSAGAGRVICARCGANNFSTVSICWKCSSPLGGSAPLPPGHAGDERGASVRGPAASVGDGAAARRAAVWMALLLPWIGLPVGWAFIMTGEPGRQEVGRFCVLWSSIAMVFHMLLLWAGTAAMVPLLIRALSMMPHGGGGGGVNGLGGLP